MDMVTNIQPRRARMKKGKTQQGGRSNYGAMRDAAKQHQRTAIKAGYKDALDRCENDPFFYLFNCALAQLTPAALRFMDKLASCISLDQERTWQQREDQEGTGVRTRLIFVPDLTRHKSLPLDLTHECKICHHGRFFSPAHFAVYVKKVAIARGEPVPVIHGWSGPELACDQDEVEELLRDIIDFAGSNFDMIYDQHDRLGEVTDERMPVATPVTDLPRGFSRLSGSMNPNMNREFNPKRPEASSSMKGKDKGKGKGKGKQEERICYKCGEPGHLARDCWYSGYRGKGSWGSSSWQSWSWQDWSWNASSSSSSWDWNRGRDRYYTERHENYGQPVPDPQDDIMWFAGDVGGDDEVLVSHSEGSAGRNRGRKGRSKGDDRVNTPSPPRRAQQSQRSRQLSPGTRLIETQAFGIIREEYFEEMDGDQIRQGTRVIFDDGSVELQYW